MNRKLIENLHQYFEQKVNKNEEEHRFLNELIGELPYFNVTSVSREDLESKGFNTSNIDDSDMETLARKMGDDYCEQLYWTSMEIIAEDYLEIPKHICPKCGKKACSHDGRSKRSICGRCAHEWTLSEPT